MQRVMRIENEQPEEAEEVDTMARQTGTWIGKVDGNMD